MRTILDIPDDWGWYFKMSLLETMEIIYCDEIQINWSSTFGIAIETIFCAPGVRQPFDICHHNVTKRK